MRFFGYLGIAILNGISFYLVVDKGVLAVGVAYVLISTLNFIVGRFLLRYLISLNINEYLTAIAKPFLLSIVMGILVYGLYFLVNPLSISNILLLGLLIAIGILIYLIEVRLFAPVIIKTIIKKLKT